jgi:hypothetical protein
LCSIALCLSYFATFFIGQLQKNRYKITKMQLAINTLYSDGILNKFTDGSSQLTRARVRILPKLNDAWHRLNEGESIFELANRYYGNQAIWWLIADANLIVKPFDILELVGRYLLIPNFDTFLYEQSIQQNRHTQVVGELAEGFEQDEYASTTYDSGLPSPSLPPTLPTEGGILTVVDSSKRNFRAFFLMPNGGYRMQTTDADGAGYWIIDDPTRYDNSIIFEQPILPKLPQLGVD